jgi:hypothetical protein
MGSKDPKTGEGNGWVGDDLFAGVGSDADEPTTEFFETVTDLAEITREVNDDPSVTDGDSPEAVIDPTEVGAAFILVEVTGDPAEAGDDPGEPAADDQAEVAAITVEVRTGVVGIADLITEITQLVNGMLTIAVRAVRSALVPEGAAEADEPSLLELIPAAAVALMVEAERRTLQAAVAIDEQVGPVVRRIARVPIIRAPFDIARRSIEQLSSRGAAEQERAALATQSLLELVLPGVVDAVLDRIDLNDIVARVDVERVLERVDLDAVMASVNIGDIIERVDIDAVVARVDLDAAIARVDIDAVIKRLDLAGLTSEVMTEVDLREIVRESSSSITGEAVDAVRVQGMNADRFVSRIVDKLLMRRSGRDIAGPSNGNGTGAAAPAIPGAGTSATPAEAEPPLEPEVAAPPEPGPDGEEAHEDAGRIPVPTT